MQHTGVYCILFLLTIAAVFLAFTNLSSHRNPADWLRIEAQLTDIVRLPIEHSYDSILYQGIYQGNTDTRSYQFYSSPVTDFASLKRNAIFCVNPENPEDYQPEYSYFDQGKGFLLLCVPALGFCALHSAGDNQRMA